LNSASIAKNPVISVEAPRLPRHELVTAAGAIVTVVFLAHFYLIGQFGLYEDDYLWVLPWLHVSSHKAAAFALDALIHPFQGRPIYFPAQALLAHFTFRIGGLGLLHLVSFGLLALLGVLVYCVIRQVTTAPIAFLAGVLFVLYPADTSRQIVMHQCATLLPMCICMCAILLYVRGKLVTSYAVAALTLLIYESTYFPFLLAPLFTLRQGPINLKRVLKHVVLFIALAAAIFLVRMFLGESRAQEVSGGLPVIVPKMLRALWIGPLTSGFLLFQRPIDTYLHGQLGHWFIIVGSAAVCTLGLSRLGKCEPKQRGFLPIWPWLIAGGCAAWSMSYLLDFRPDYYPPIVSVGRLSAVHEVGAFGCALAFAGALSFVDQAWKPAGLAARIAATAIVAGLAGFGYEIQLSEYVRNWQQQEEFWRELVPLIQDAAPGDVVMCAFDQQLGGIPVTSGFTQFGQTFYNYVAFPRFLTLPAAKSRPPTLHGYCIYTPIDIIDGVLTIKSPFWDNKNWAKISDGKVIFIKAGKAHLERVSGEIDLQGHRFFARPPGASSGQVAFTRFFHQLFDDASETRWWSLHNAPSYPY
jgi:hypothetical protein